MKTLHPPHFMQNPVSYYNHIKTINGVKFTPREIDVTACLLSGKGSKTIAYFLSIEEKTVETHKYNVMRKLDCNSKEGIIEFIERSDKFSALKQHYLSLLSEAMFEKSLSKILSFTKNSGLKCLIIYDKDKENAHFINQLEKHLKLGGVKVSGEAKGNHKSLSHLLHYLDSQEIDSLIYLMSKSSFAKLKEADTQAKLEAEELIQKLAHNKRKTLFLLQNEDPSLDIPSAIQSSKYIDFGTQNNYYFSILEVLHTLLPNPDLEKIISEFKKQYEIIYDSSEKTSSQLWSQISDLTEEEKSGRPLFSGFSKGKKRGLFLGGTLTLSGVCLLFVNLNNHSLYPREQPNKVQGLEQSIRSDLSIPADKTLLNRPKQLTQIEESLKGKEAIQTVALIGTGGAGKTTLARQYAKSQKSPVVWEINAETNGSLMGSFEALAYALCQSEEERKMLKGLQEIKKSDERQDKIVLFVKERMNLHPNWFLIFDNVEKLDAIQKYYPSDSNTWGTGKIIITTRDANIQNNNHINNIVYMGELNPQEKLSLFMNIMRQGHIHQATATQQEQAQEFLNFIPPFPLDISIAAYYIKATEVSFEKYLEYLKENSQSFENIQEKILKETDEYTKTRYSIITLSLKQLIDIQEDFKGLLFFVSLLDSQNIPKDLLSAFKNNVVIDSFIYHLKKYSFITNESGARSVPSISFHRSSQAICLNYLSQSFDLKEKDQILREIGAGLEKYMAKAIDEDDLLPMKGHCEVILKHPDVSADIAKGSARCTLGAIYFYLGNYGKAKYFLEENLSELNKNDKENHPVLGRTYGYLGTVYRAIGDYKKGEEYLEQALVTYQKHLPEDHTREAWILAQKGIVYRELGDYKKAEELIGQSYVLTNAHFPKDHLRMAWILATSAMVDIELENYEKARELLEQSLIIYRKHYSDNHIRVAWVQANLGNVYRELGDYEKAKNSLEQSLVVFQKYYFDSHVQFVRVLRNLGNLYRELGDYEKAKSFIEKSLAICEMTYGKDHIDMAWGSVSLGEIYLAEGKMDTAETHIKKAALLLQKKRHPTSYKALEMLSDLFAAKATDAVKSGNKQLFQTYMKEAIGYLRQALNTPNSTSKNSPHIVRIQTKFERLTQQMQS